MTPAGLKENGWQVATVAAEKDEPANDGSADVVSIFRAEGA
jgi:hypothetical protein